ncbi:Putative ATP-dependent RNA helicase R563 [Faustovirus ST1]|nr:Putative ATP-dependent RNA helicase R563 [Faustovirus ST1]
MTDLSRNSTNFPVRLLEYFKSLEFPTEYDFLHYYQNITRHYFVNVKSGARGLLAGLEMGLGKTILAIAIAMDMMKEYQPIIILTKSLQGNFTNNIIKYIKMRGQREPDYHLARLSEEDIRKWVDRNFGYVSLNAGNMMTQLLRKAEGQAAEEFDEVLEARMGEVNKLGSLDGKLIIVDEAHNLSRQIINGSKNGIKFYENAMSAKDAKFLFLTGTPVDSDPFQYVPMFNIIGSRWDDKLERFIPLLPEMYKDFYDNFIDTTNMRIKNKAKFQNRIMGLASRVTSKSKPGSAKEGSTVTSLGIEFPEELPMEIVRVEMEPAQYVMYLLARDSEKEETTRGGRVAAASSMTRPKSDKSSSYRVRSRQLSNYLPPTGVKTVDQLPTTPGSVYSVKFEAILNNINRHKNGLGLVYSQFVELGGLSSFAKYLEQNNWEEYVPKISTTKAAKTGSNDINIPIGNMYFGEDNIINTDSKTIDYLDNTRWSFISGKTEFIKIKHQGEINIDLTAEVMIVKFTGNTLLTIDGVVRKINGVYETIIHNAQVNIKSGGMCAIKAYNIRESNAFMVGGGAFTWRNSDNMDIEGLDGVVGGDDAPASPTTAKVDNTTSRRRFAVIRGGMSIEQREDIINRFNAPENRYGKDLALVLVSSSGAEGLDFKRGRHVHIMEPYWKWSRIEQVKHRFIRANSHVDMKPEEKNVQVYVYLAIATNFAKLEKANKGVELTPEQLKALAERGEELKEPSTDMELFDDAYKEHKLNENVNEAVWETTIECLLNAEPGCRICQPDSRKLFTDDVFADLRASDPCRTYEYKTVSAQPITVANTTYYYRENPESVYGYSAFEFDADLKAYTVVDEASAIFSDIMDAIREKITTGK